MKKVLALMLVMAMLAITTLAFAGGDQNCENNRGEKGKGKVARHQNSGNGM